MGSLISHLIVSLILIGGTCAESLYFTNYPTDVVVGSKYTVTWQGGDYSDPCTLSLVKGANPDGSGSVVEVIESSLSGTYCDWYPTSNLTYGNDYTLMLQQNTFTTLSLAFSIGNATSSASATAAATTTMTSSAAASSAVAPVATPPATSTLPVNIVNPTPTSSFDAPVEADTHLTVNDKIAIGIGIPIALLVLGTIGYWRAVKFYFHRKVTGESKLPMFDKSGVAPPTIVVGSGLRQSSAGRNSTWSNAPSLWGANSRRSSRAGPERSDDTELLTAPPKSVHSSPRPPRDSSVGSIRSPSALRQEWHPL